MRILTTPPPKNEEYLENIDLNSHLIVLEELPVSGRLGRVSVLHRRVFGAASLDHPCTDYHFLMLSPNDCTRFNGYGTTNKTVRQWLKGFEPHRFRLHAFASLEEFCDWCSSR